jgi:hypothetical protein
MDWAWMEGSRTFDLVWGLVTGTLCLALAVPILWWQLPAQRRSFFGTAVDPQQRLQLGYGIFCMAMAWTNVGCRTIPHGNLAFVHPTFFVITLVLIAGLGPRVVWMLAHPQRALRARTA